MIRNNEWKKVVAGLCLLAAPLALLARPALAIPEFPKDVLADCVGLNATGSVPMAQAVPMVQVCLNNLYAGRIFTVTAEGGRFGWAPPCPRGGVACPRIVEEVEGIIIKVKGTLPIGNSVLLDLQYSLSQRGGKLLGWAAALDSSQVRSGPSEARFFAADASATELTCSGDVYAEALKISISGATGLAAHYDGKGTVADQASLDSRYLPDGDQIKGPAGTTTYFAQGFGDGDTEFVYLAVPNSVSAGGYVTVIEMLKSDRDATNANPLGISRYSLSCSVSK